MARMGVTLDVGSDGVAVITMRNPPVNALAIPVLDGLKEKFDEAMGRNDVKAVVLTGQGGRFSGGFDINVFAKVHQKGDLSLLPNVSVDLVVNTIEDAKKPIVAAVEGLALGGGLEVSMGCHARVAAPGAQLGLPELSLGVIPGFGGTQRLPRLLGLSKSIEMMLTSKPILSEEGQKLGLIDLIVSPGDLLKVSREWALDIANGRKPWLRSLHRTDKLPSLSEARKIIRDAREHAKKTAIHLPQHQACLDVMEDGVIHGGYNGVLKETKVFNELVLSDTSKGLVHTFFAQRATTKVPNVTDVGLKPRNIKKVAVIGGGLMGSGIATALIVSDIYVVIKEINSEYLQKGIKTIKDNIRGLVTRGKLMQSKAEKALLMFKGTLDYSDFRDVDMVIEAVIENIPLKQAIFGEIEKICPSHCILASNTSSIDLHIVGEKTTSQDRIIGAHFFSWKVGAHALTVNCLSLSVNMKNPAHVMPLLEIVRTEKTSPQVILDLMTVGKIIKKVPVVVGNCVGFAVNRAFFPYSQGANLLVNLGVDLFRVDRVIRDFGIPIGPFQLADVGGYGVGIAVGKVFADAFGNRTYRTPLAELMIKNGRNGKSNGKGYYTHEKGKKPVPDPSVTPIIEQSRRLANIMPGGKPIIISDKEVLEMILFPVVNEACRVLEEKVVIRASDLDIASVLGMSFPSYRGGIVFWADSVGPNHIYQSLKKWSQLYGNFYTPSSFLEERATRGIPLSTPVSPSPKSKL